MTQPLTAIAGAIAIGAWIAAVITTARLAYGRRTTRDQYIELTAWAGAATVAVAVIVAVLANT